MISDPTHFNFAHEKKTKAKKAAQEKTTKRAKMAQQKLELKKQAKLAKKLAAHKEMSNKKAAVSEKKAKDHFKHLNSASSMVADGVAHNLDEANRRQAQLNKQLK